jgi:hypothetical protein
MDNRTLELAAKAAGVDYKRLPHAWPHRFDDEIWAPQIDMGEALALALKLGISIVFMEESDSVGAEHSRHGIIIIEPMCDVGVCRPIVRAAAAIGETMP